MPFLVLFLLALTCLQPRWPQPDWLTAVDLDTARLSLSLSTWGGVWLLIGWAAAVVWQFERRLQADPGRRVLLMRRFNRLRRYQLLVLIAFQVLALYQLGWGWLVQSIFADGASRMPVGVPQLV